MSQPLSRDSGFVGRQDEMAELTAALDEALAGRGRLVMLVGEPGIGKTRTAQEMAALVETRGDPSVAIVVWGHDPTRQPGRKPGRQSGRKPTRNPWPGPSFSSWPTCPRKYFVVRLLVKETNFSTPLGERREISIRLVSADAILLQSTAVISDSRSS